MKAAYQGSAGQRKAVKAAEKYMVEQYNELRYSAFKENAEDMTKQIEAAMLYALSRHGYGAKRLQEIHGWFKEVLELPNVFGKPVNADAVMKTVRDKYGIDLDEIRVRIESHEDFEKK